MRAVPRDGSRVTLAIQLADGSGLDRVFGMLRQRRIDVVAGTIESLPRGAALVTATLELGERSEESVVKLVNRMVTVVRTVVVPNDGQVLAIVRARPTPVVLAAVLAAHAVTVKVRSTRGAALVLEVSGPVAAVDAFVEGFDPADLLGQARTGPVDPSLRAVPRRQR